MRFVERKRNEAAEKKTLARSIDDRDDLDPHLSLSLTSKKKTPQLFPSFYLSQACSKRIEGKADAHCTGQFFDMWHCIDKCVAPRLMPLLK